MQKAQESGVQMDVQVVNDLRQFLDRLEKRNHDLKLALKWRFNKRHKNSFILKIRTKHWQKIQS